MLTPSARSQRGRLLRHLGLFLAAAVPVALVVGLLVSWLAALVYVVVQTSVLMFGVRQQRTSVLRVDEVGLQYEAPSFLLRAGWSDLESVDRVELPSGPTAAFRLRRSGLRWAHTPQVRRQVTERGWDALIPIDEFEPAWPAGPLGEAVRSHRPDLLAP